MDSLPEVKGEDSVPRDTVSEVHGNFLETNLFDVEDAEHHVEQALYDKVPTRKLLDVEDVPAYSKQVFGKSSDASHLDAEIAEHSIEKASNNVDGESPDTKSLDAQDIGPTIVSSPSQVLGKSSDAKTLDAIIAKHFVEAAFDDIYRESPDTKHSDDDVKHSMAPSSNLDHQKSSLSNGRDADIAEHSVETASNHIIGKSADTKPLDAEISEHFVETDFLDVKPLGAVNADETTLNGVHEKDSNPLGTENANLSVEMTSKQLVLYTPPAAKSCQDMIDLPGSAEKTSSFRRSLFRGLPSIGAFTIQCANCFKWRLIPTKEKYEEIRESILQTPFLCERARQWRPEVSCTDPTDITPDGSRLWAIDKPNIAQPPRGWERLLRIRGEGGTRFADVYYVAPCGKKLRSMVEVERYLSEHPQYISAGVKLSQFSFQIPRPLRENYVRKRPARPVNLNASGDFGSHTQPEPNEVNPISWVPPTNLDLQIGSPGLSVPPLDPSSNHIHPEQAIENKRRKKPMPYSNEMYWSSMSEQPKVEADDCRGGCNDPCYDP